MKNVVWCLRCGAVRRARREDEAKEPVDTCDCGGAMFGRRYYRLRGIPFPVVANVGGGQVAIKGDGL